MPQSAQDLLDMFNLINEDCAKSGEPVVPLSDIEYYGQQIDNIFEMDDWQHAEDIAREVYQLSLKEEK